MPDIDDMACPEYCASCGDYFDYDVDGTYSDCGEYYCSDCGPCTCCDCGNCGCYDCGMDREDSRVHQWDWKPRPFVPKGNYPSEVLMGLELEIGGSPTDIADAVGDVDPSEYHLYLKEDGSIDGAEIVTHPMTLKWSRQWAGGDWAERVLRGLRSRGCYVTSGYGLHVHVSRNAFQLGPMRERSATHQLTWLLFHYRNPDKLETLARRCPERWGRFHKPQRRELLRKAQANGGYRDDRYLAVNCNNEKTYELRFFMSTLSPTEMRAALEYADASVEYTRRLKSSDILRDGALQWHRFASWVESSNQYPNLVDQLDTHGLSYAMTNPNR